MPLTIPARSRSTFSMVVWESSDKLAWIIRYPAYTAYYRQKRERYELHRKGIPYVVVAECPTPMLQTAYECVLAELLTLAGVEGEPVL